MIASVHENFGRGERMPSKNSLTEKNFTDISQQMPNDEFVNKLADFFAIFGDTTRMQLLMLLRFREMNVTDIAQALNMSISAVSHQLKTLRQNDLVRTRREGKYIYYYLSDDHVVDIIDQGGDHILEDRFGVTNEKGI